MHSMKFSPHKFTTDFGFYNHLFLAGTLQSISEDRRTAFWIFSLSPFYFVLALICTVFNILYHPIPTAKRSAVGVKGHGSLEMTIINGCPVS